MDDESKLLLREIRDLQKQQLELLRAWLPPSGLPFQFSLRATNRFDDCGDLYGSDYAY